MKSRLIASLSVGVAIVLGTTGCSLIARQATSIEYSPSDGVTVFGGGPIDVRNAFIVANETGSVGNFVAAIVNPTGETQTLTMQLRTNDGESGDEITVRVPGNTTYSLGAEPADDEGDGEQQGGEPILIEGLDSIPGSTVLMYFQSGDSEGILRSVPVLDGTLDYYRDLEPSETG